LLLETGGVRLQEANLGLEAIAEINSSLIALRQHVPVVGVIAGMVGCFGGMSINSAVKLIKRRWELVPLGIHHFNLFEVFITGLAVLLCHR
jgi:hypothetical protein